MIRIAVLLLAALPVAVQAQTLTYDTGKAKAAEDKKMRDDEVEQLRAELAALQAKVDRLGH